jgi:flavin reductase (DIM6/NTAB) family NADH-FMN oxidoreductase RutF
MIIDPSERTSRQLYKLMVSAVVPRPIAWVSTRSAAGVINVAPFSYFQVVGSRPPMVSICIGPRKWDGEVVDKDTLRNIEETGELVVNIATVDAVEAVNASSAEYPPEVSERDALRLETIPSDLVAPPRLAASPIHFECRRERVLRLGQAPQTAMVIGEVVRFHIADALWDAEADAIDPGRLRPLARLGGSLFAELGELLSHPRPPAPHAARSRFG